MLEGLEQYVGPAAGVATSVLWTGTSLFFTLGGRRIGPTIVNASRIGMAIVLLAVTHRFIAGTWFPPAIAGQVMFLAVSGLVGLAIGDQALLVAFVDVGPRISMLIMATAPLWAVLFGWLALGETLDARAWTGVLLIIGGVVWVVLERPQGKDVRHSPHRVRGLILAFFAAACQAGGLLLSKQGMGHGWLPDEQHMSPQAATLVRMVFAGMGMLPILWLNARRERRRRAAGIASTLVGSRGAGYFFTACGAVCGPFLGVWMSLVASDRAAVGIAQALCSLVPVFILPFVIWIEKERVSPRAAIGAVVAVGGSALLFLQPQG